MPSSTYLAVVVASLHRTRGRAILPPRRRHLHTPPVRRLQRPSLKTWKSGNYLGQECLWALILASVLALPILAFARVWRRLELLSWSFEAGKPVAPSWLDIRQMAVSYGAATGYHLRAEIRRHKDSPEPRSLEFGCTWEIGAQATIESDPIGSIASEKKYITPWPTGTHSFSIDFEETGFPDHWCLVLYILSKGPVLIRRVWVDT